MIELFVNGPLWILKGEIPWGAFLLSLVVGVAMILLFLFISYRIWKG